MAAPRAPFLNRVCSGGGAASASPVRPSSGRPVFSVPTHCAPERARPALCPSCVHRHQSTRMSGPSRNNCITACAGPPSPAPNSQSTLALLAQLRPKSCRHHRRHCQVVGVRPCMVVASLPCWQVHNDTPRRRPPRVPQCVLHFFFFFFFSRTPAPCRRLLARHQLLEGSGRLQPGNGPPPFQHRIGVPPPPRG